MSIEVEKDSATMEDETIASVFTPFDPDKTPTWSCNLEDLAEVKPLANEGHKHRLKMRPNVRPPTKFAKRSLKNKV